MGRPPFLPEGIPKIGLIMREGDVSMSQNLGWIRRGVGPFDGDVKSLLVLTVVDGPSFEQVGMGWDHSLTLGKRTVMLDF